MKVGVIDYGMGNIGSVLNMLKKIGVPAAPLNSPEGARDATHLILPGVGTFSNGMANLATGGWIDPLNSAVHRGTFLLGICLGVQLLTRRSEEGTPCEGLGYIGGDTRKFSFAPGSQHRIPHMGWNDVTPAQTHPLLAGLETDNRFYFVHSYHLCLDDDSTLVGSTEYGYSFPSVVAKDNVMGVQFHPEKSHAFGMQLLRNFSSIC